MRARCGAVTTSRDVGPLSPERWEGTAREEWGPMLWEATREGMWAGAAPVMFTQATRRLAAKGIVQWGHITDERTGGWLAPSRLQERFGGTFDALDKAAYKWLIERMCDAVREERAEAWKAWVCSQGSWQPPVVRREEAERERHNVKEIVGARRTAVELGGWEYLVEWEEGDTTWEPQVHLEGRGVALTLAMHGARDHLHMHASLYEALEMACTETGEAGDRARRVRDAVRGRPTIEAYKWCMRRLQGTLWSDSDDEMGRPMEELTREKGREAWAWEHHGSLRTRTLYNGKRAGKGKTEVGWEEVTTEAESGDGEVQRPTIESVDAIAEMGDEAGEESPHGGR